MLDAEWLGAARQIVGINIAASEKWLTKNWPLEHTARLCDILAAENIRVLFTGTEKDQAAARRLMGLTRTKPANLVGKTDILELAAVIERCAVFVTPDSAPLHIAAAMGTPVVAFFGPTSSRRHLPPVDRAVVLERNLPCQPCYSGRCRLQTRACLAEITPEEGGRPHSGSAGGGPMKILLLTTHLNTGGITSYLLTLSRQLVARGHRVWLASAGGRLAPVFAASGVECLTVNIRTKSELDPRIYLAVRQLIPVIRANGIEVVHAQTRITQVMGWWLQRLAGTGACSTCHGFFTPRWSRRVFPCWGQRVIAISPAVGEHLRRDLGVPAERGGGDRQRH